MNKTVAVGGGMWESLRTCVGEREVMDSGQTRFTLKDQGDYLDLRLHQQEAWLAWLVQAPGVFHALRVLLDNDLTDYHLITPEIRLNGYLSRSEDTRQRRQKQPVYLFVCPPSPDTAFESCTTQSLHWWSCHPSGEPSLSEDVCEQLGLPVELSLWVGRFREFSWQSEQYKALHHYQLARGFNPDTLDFARYLGYPIYQVLRGSGRFEEMVEEVPETPANVQSTGKKVSGLWSTVSASISAWSWAASEDLDIPAVGL
ncbi:hypothetical protein V5O48_016696 [Marasmius crinis-equi]|uniref:Uncharacterized protein n=1 Tax=Marasmius crinis-equi TaxID=585013 RepID=A0ABR3ER49_9AGAR